MSEFAITILPDQQCLEIDGIRYSFNIFKHLGMSGLPEGTYFKILERADGMLSLTTFFPEEAYAPDP